MKIAMFGTTLYAGVISSLLAESGHQVFICNDLQDHTALFNLRDQDVVRSLEKQHKSGFLSYCDFAALPLDIDAYFFSFNRLSPNVCTADSVQNKENLPNLIFTIKNLKNRNIILLFLFKNR